MALLRWFRFLDAIGVPWDQATRVEARDFSRWVQVGAKPVRPHWRHGQESGGAGRVGAGAGAGVAEPGDRQDAAGTEVRAGHGRAQRDGAAQLYAFALEAGVRADGEPFSAGQEPSWRAGKRPP
jgi:hypothetical protein